MDAEQREFARTLRQHTTDHERIIWRALRSRQMQGLKFRRQHPVAPYVLDFYCHTLRLAIELDGGQHLEPDAVMRDKRRSQYLAGYGIEMLRFDNRQVMTQRDEVLAAIWHACERRRIAIGLPPSP